MSLLLVEGVAGTGKTTRLLEESRDHLAKHPLGANQRSLALTKFHGSRRRMEAKLTGSSGVGYYVDCLTIDSFAWSILRRWRSLVRHLGINFHENDFASVTSAAGQLLRHSAVVDWVTRRNPLLVVDELQDCKGGEVEILAHLARQIKCLCAGDGFQDLSGAKENEAIAWAKAEGEVLTLKQVERTLVKGLLDAASALRNGEPLKLGDSSGFEIVTVPKAPLGAARVSWSIKSWSTFGQVAIISPCKPKTSPFVDKLLEWVGTKAATNKKNKATAGPFHIQWEVGEDALCQDITEMLDLPKSPDEHVSCRQLADKAERARFYDIRDWLDRQRNVSGRETIPTSTMINQIGWIIHRRRAFGRPRDQRRVVTTVHQAKNREFESVIVLWPLRLTQDKEQQRRLLYNAISRAKRQVLVIVEDPKRDRLNNSPFVAHGFGHPSLLL